MAGLFPFPGAALRRTRSRTLPGTALAGVLLALLATPVLAEQGQWTPAADWSGGNPGKYAVHMLLFPGDGSPYHSRLLWFYGQPGATFSGGEWGWKSGNDGCGTFPSASFEDLNVSAPGMDIFCTGHAGLPDGRVLMPGGTDHVTGSYGENKTRIFARGSGDSAGSWSDPGPMRDWRWYATGTTLRDGRVPVTAGLRHRHHRIFGGRSSGAPFAGDSGAVVTVELPAPVAASAAPVVIEASGLSAPERGILFQTPDESGAWQTVARLHPRRRFDEITLDGVAASQVRLVFLAAHQVRFVGRVVRSNEPPGAQWAELLSAESRALGDVRAALVAPDHAAASLVGPDTLEFSFGVPPLAVGQVRDCFLAVEGMLLSLRQASPAGRQPGAPATPARFALGQSQPNPSAGSVTIRFDLPVGAPVRLEVFDLQGRRLKVLANRYHPAGYHAVEWEGRDANGTPAGPGVYFYRIETGSFRDRKAMVLLP